MTGRTEPEPFTTEEFVSRIQQGVRDRMRLTALARGQYLDLDQEAVQSILDTVTAHTIALLNELAIQTNSAALLESLYMRVAHHWRGGTFGEGGEMNTERSEDD